MSHDHDPFGPLDPEQTQPEEYTPAPPEQPAEYEAGQAEPDQPLPPQPPEEYEGAPADEPPTLGEAAFADEPFPTEQSAFPEPPTPPAAPAPTPEPDKKNHHTLIKIIIIVLIILLLLSSCWSWGRMGSIGTGGTIDGSSSRGGDTVVINPDPDLAVQPSATPSPSPSISPSPTPKPRSRKPRATATPVPVLPVTPTPTPRPDGGDEQPTLLRVTFYLNYTGAPSGAYAAIDVAPGGRCAMPVTPTRDDAFFDHWNTSPDGTGADFDGSAPVTGNLTLYAQWIRSPFDVEDSENPSWNEISSGGEPAKIDLFRDSQAHNNMIISDESHGIIAPGSSGAYELNVVNGSRVDCEYLIRLVETLPEAEGGNSFLKFKLLRGGTLHKTTDAQGNERFTVTGGSYIAGSASQYVSADEVNRAFSGYVPLAASSASLRTTHTYILLWNWPYDEADQENSDSWDTALGEAAAKGQLDDYQLQITVDGQLKLS